MANHRHYPATYTVAETLKRMGVSRQTLDDWHARDRVLGRPFFAPDRHRLNPGSPWRYFVSDVESWLMSAKERENGPPEAPVEVHEGARA